MKKLAQLKDAWLRQREAGTDGATVTVAPSCVELLGKKESSPFKGMFKADRFSAYVEFDICHSAPVVAGPNMYGNYVAWHPDVLARCHTRLLHKQTNLDHLLKANDESVTHDRIVGAVVGTWYPPTPEGGWTIPEEMKDAPAIKVCGTVFRNAEDAERMITEHNQGKRKWSVSIETGIEEFDRDLGIYIPSQKKVIPAIEASEDLLEAFYLKDGKLLIGKWKGEQLAVAYGAIEGEILLRGVGYTPYPAEKTARITKILMKASASGGPAARAFSASAGQSLEDIKDLVAMRYPGARLVRVVHEGWARLKGCGFGVEAKADDPALVVCLASGRKILKKASDFLTEGASVSVGTATRALSASAGQPLGNKEE